MALRVVQRLVSIVGSSFYPGATEAIMALLPGHRVKIVREPQNPHDRNALAVYSTRQGRLRPGEKIEDLPRFAKLGYMPRGFAAEVAPLLDQGMRIDAARPASPDMQAGTVVLVAWQIPDEPGPADEPQTTDAGSDR